MEGALLLPAPSQSPQVPVCRRASPAASRAVAVSLQHPARLLRRQEPAPLQPPPAPPGHVFVWPSWASEKARRLYIHYIYVPSVIVKFSKWHWHSSFNPNKVEERNIQKSPLWKSRTSSTTQTSTVSSTTTRTTTSTSKTWTQLGLINLWFQFKTWKIAKCSLGDDDLSTIGVIICWICNVCLFKKWDIVPWMADFLREHFKAWN